MKQNKELSLAKQIVFVLETKTFAGVDIENRNYNELENGNGTNIGSHYHKLIKKAKKIIKNQKL